MGIEASRRILTLNMMSDIFPRGSNFPKDAPPFFGVQNTYELAQIPDIPSRQIAQVMLHFSQRAQQRTVALSKPGDIVPIEIDLDPDLILHVQRNCLAIDPQSVILLRLQDRGKMSLPEAIMADSTAMDRLRTYVKNQEQRWIISPFAVDDGVKKLGTELGIGWGHEWAYSPRPFGIGHSEPWRYPKLESSWSLVEANSKAQNYLLAKDIDPNWVPEGTVESSYEAVAYRVASYLLSGNFQEICVKANIHLTGMGNIKFKLHNDTIKVEYTGKEEIFHDTNEATITRIVQTKCREHGLYISNLHPAVVQKWEQFFLGLTPSVEIYIPPLESGFLPFTINECVQFIENGGFVGAINPDPLTVSMRRLKEIPPAYWESLGISRNDYILHYRTQYLAAWELQRQHSLTFGKEMQKRGEVGHRDFDFGIVVNSNGTMYPKKCESNARRTGTWVADTIGRRFWGNKYMNKGYILAIDNVKGPALDKTFKAVCNLFTTQGVIFLPQTENGIIITGHVRDGASSRMRATILGKEMTKVWQNYKLAQELAKGT